MLFYHVSSQKFDTLLPVVGASRHGGEDPRAVDKPVVWLSNDPRSYREDSEGMVARYQHEVDIPENDPDLHMDEGFDHFMKEADAAFPDKPPSLLRWYFCFRAVKVTRVGEWDATARRYV